MVTNYIFSFQLFTVADFILICISEWNFSWSCRLWIISTVLRCKQYCKETSAAFALCGSFPQLCAASSTANKLQLQLLFVDHFHSSALQAVLQTNFSCSSCLWIISTVLRCKQYCKQTSAAVAVCGTFIQFCTASSTANKLQLQLLSVDYYHSSAMQAVLQTNFSCSCCLWIISTVLRCKQYSKKLQLQLLSVDHFHSSNL